MLRARIPTILPKNHRPSRTFLNKRTLPLYSDPAAFHLATEALHYGASFTKTLSRHTDSTGRPRSLNVSTEYAAAYGFDAAGRLEKVWDHPTLNDGEPVENASFSYGYVNNSNALVKTVTGPAHTVTNTWEDTRDVLAAIQNKAGGTVRSNYDYSTVNGGVNKLGQRMGVRTSFNLGAITGNSGDTKWGYDSLGQLTSAADSTTAANSRAYQYDSIGNRLIAEKGAAQIPATPDLNTTSYTPDALNQYDAIIPYSAAGIAGTPVVPVFDDDGNMTTGPLSGTGGSTASHLKWDAENRLIEVRTTDDTTVIASYAYDGLSRRIACTVDSVTTLYVYDGWNCIAEYTIQDSTFKIQKSYLWGLDLSRTLQGAGGVGGLLAATLGSTTYYPTFDGNGNVSEYLTVAGVVAAHFEYDPFGNTLPTSSGNTALFNYRFSTKPLDFTTGLYYYGYRYY